MFQQPKWFRENFALSHACAGVVAYSFAIIVVNLDKSVAEILVLVVRQAVMTFLFTGFLVPRVQKRAIGDNALAVVFWGILMPATIVAVASTLAHRYWSEEERNILAPFLVSVVLNTGLVSARRAGHETFLTQVKWFMSKIGFTR